MAKDKSQKKTNYLVLYSECFDLLINNYQSIYIKKEH